MLQVPNILGHSILTLQVNWPYSTIKTWKASKKVNCKILLSFLNPCGQLFSLSKLVSSLKIGLFKWIQCFPMGYFIWAILHFSHITAAGALKQRLNRLVLSSFKFFGQWSVPGSLGAVHIFSQTEELIEIEKVHTVG